MLRDPTSAILTFQAPEVTADTQLVFSLVVSDGQLESEPSTTSVQVRELNRPPAANAGPDLTVPMGARVKLDGSASQDPDGDLLSYQWRQVSGPPAAITGANSPTPIIQTPDAEGELVFELSTRDGEAFSTLDTMKMTVTHASASTMGCTCSAGEGGAMGFGALLLLAGIALWPKRPNSRAHGGRHPEHRVRKVVDGTKAETN
jgi:MYXO-CTERM domain-containing protein